MKLMMISATIFASFAAYAAPADFTCHAQTMTQAEVDSALASMPFTLGKIAAEGRSETFAPVDQDTAKAVRDFFYTADYIDSQKFVSGVICTKPVADQPGELEYDVASNYELTGYMADSDYVFCETKLELTVETKSGLGAVSQTISAKYVPNTNPEDAVLCSQASGKIPN